MNSTTSEDNQPLEQRPNTRKQSASSRTSGTPTNRRVYNNTSRNGANPNQSRNSGNVSRSSNSNRNRTTSQSKPITVEVLSENQQHANAKSDNSKNTVASPKKLAVGRSRTQSVTVAGPVKQPPAQQASKQQPNQPITERVIVVKRSDMIDEMLDFAIEIALSGLKQNTMERNVAMNIKSQFDKKYHGTWHCIVGHSFGSFVTHEARHFAFFYVDQIAVVLYKSCGN